MTTILSKSILYIVFLLLGFFQSINAQIINKKDVVNHWKLNKYSINSKNYSPPKKDAGDYLLFTNDMSFTTVFEGVKEFGEWNLNPKKGIIYLHENKDDKNPLKLYIQKLTSNSLIIRLDIFMLRKIDFHYTAKKND
ncbi:hypothetical protein [Aquimarina longa]|uniref:hypothetical protein n=1 Tax=Aquimarina longa TaxID=1080221 RepID=UPI000781C7C4|nr:hypothetical protein [Aquimarina longa]